MNRHKRNGMWKKPRLNKNLNVPLLLRLQKKLEQAKDPETTRESHDIETNMYGTSFPSRQLTTGDEITTADISGHVITPVDSTPLPVVSLSINSTMLPVDTVSTNSTMLPVDTVSTNSSMLPVDTMSTYSSMLPVDTVSINSTMLPVDTVSTSSTMLPVDTVSINCTMLSIDTTPNSSTMLPVETLSKGRIMIPADTALTIDGSAEDVIDGSDKLQFADQSDERTVCTPSPSCSMITVRHQAKSINKSLSGLMLDADLISNDGHNNAFVADCNRTPLADTSILNTAIVVNSAEQMQNDDYNNLSLKSAVSWQKYHPLPIKSLQVCKEAKLDTTSSSDCINKERKQSDNCLTGRTACIESSVNWLSVKRKKNKCSRFTRIKRRKVQLDDTIDLFNKGDDLSCTSHKACLDQPDADSVFHKYNDTVSNDQLDIEKPTDTCNARLLTSGFGDMDMAKPALVASGDTDITDIGIESQSVNAMPFATSHVSELCLDDLVLPFDDEVDVTEPPVIDNIVNLVLPFDEPQATAQMTQGIQNKVTSNKKRQGQPKQRRPHIFFTDEMTLATPEAEHGHNCTTKIDSITEEIFDPERQKLSFDVVAADEVNTDASTTEIPGSLEDQQLNIEDPKPKKKSTRRSATFEIINSSFQIISPDLNSPPESSYLPLGYPTSRRSKRLRRKSLEIYKAQSRKMKDSQDDEILPDLTVEEEKQDIQPIPAEVSEEETIKDELPLEVVAVVSNEMEPSGPTGIPESVDPFIATVASCDDEGKEDVVGVDSTSDLVADIPDKDITTSSSDNAVTDSSSPSGRTMRKRQKKPLPVQKGAPTKNTLATKKTKNVTSVEDIYLNKMWRTQMPVEKSWETIHEQPVTKKSGIDEYLSKKRFKRNINFEEFYAKNRLKKRRQKALKQGWKPKTAKQDAAASVLLTEKLSNLENELQLEGPEVMKNCVDQNKS